MSSRTWCQGAWLVPLAGGRIRRGATIGLDILRNFSRRPLSINWKMLYLIGLGLCDETDVTVKGLELIKRAERVYLEAYTSILLVDTEKLVRK